MQSITKLPQFKTHCQWNINTKNTRILGTFCQEVVACVVDAGCVTKFSQIRKLQNAR